MYFLSEILVKRIANLLFLYLKRNMLVYVYNVLIEHNKLSHIEDLTRKNTSPETHFVFIVFTIIHVRSIV